MEAVHLDARAAVPVGPAADRYLAEATLSSAPTVEQATPARAGPSVFGVEVGHAPKLAE
jgi:hypothetical protein